jgi:hypothetical protein
MDLVRAVALVLVAALMGSARARTERGPYRQQRTQAGLENSHDPE